MFLLQFHSQFHQFVKWNYQPKREQEKIAEKRKKALKVKLLDDKKV